MSSSPILIREYEPRRDEPAAFILWQRTLGDFWPVSRDAFHDRTVGSGLFLPGDHYVSEAEGDLIGFVATQARSLPGVQPDLQPRGELMAIAVDPQHRHQGIGRALVTRATARLKERGMQEIQLGSGGLSYFWAGVPTNLPGAWQFFEACGWPRVEASYDLVRPLEGYTTPPEVYERIRLPNIIITTAEETDVPRVLAFEGRYFPRWLTHYETTVAHGEHSDIVLAKDTRTGDVVGTSMVMDFRVPWRRHDFVWQSLLGDNTGGVGPLGVAEDRRENGIGLALAARVTELLTSRGVATSFVGYTWLVDWYGRLGYRVWRQYDMGWIRL